MSALDELLDGAVGEHFVTLLRRTVLAVALARNFPPPSGGTWTRDEVASVTNSFLADPQTERRLADLALHCADDRALARRLQGAVRNFLRDLGRATEVGRLVVRVARALREHDGFVAAGTDRWTVAGGRSKPSMVNPDVLVAATTDVDVLAVRWSATSARRQPFADRATIELLIARVLEAADGALTTAEIAKAVAPRLAVVAQPVVAELDGGDFPDTGLGRHTTPADLDATGDLVANRLRAEEVLAQLSDRERIAIAYPELVVRELGPRIGVSHSQAHLIRQHAIAVVRDELADDEAGQETAELVLELARDWVTDRTAPRDTPYLPA